MKVITDIDNFKCDSHIVLTPGTFDGVHIGHQTIIQRIKEIAKSKNGKSVVLSFYPHPRMVLFPDTSLELITTQEEKIAQLERQGIDYFVVIPFTKEFSRLSATEYIRDILINKIGVKTLVIGYDHHFGKNREGNFENLVELSQILDFNVEEIPAQDIDNVNISSTKIRKAIEVGDFETANKYLGYQFSITGEVVEGNGIGKSIDFPTANIQVSEYHKIIPGNGVYAVNISIEENDYKGMLNIGYNPTIGNTEKTIEVNIFDFNENIYGQEVTISFLKKLRNEKKFDSLEELKMQLQLDKDLTLNIS